MPNFLFYKKAEMGSSESEKGRGDFYYGFVLGYIFGTIPWIFYINRYHISYIFSKYKV